jgi:8-oxo-dGTP diphosphatase
MNNFKVVIGTKEYWVSRSMAVAVFIYALDKNRDNFILANKRGINTPDYQGCWCCPCGYLDYDETLVEAAIREVYEETGFKLSPCDIKNTYIDDDPSDTRQNVTVIFKAFVYDMQKQNITNKNAEHNEVDDIKWINCKLIDEYKWAFNHDHIIKTKYLDCNYLDIDQNLED